jgi:hypothetical protein
LTKSQVDIDAKTYSRRTSAVSPPTFATLSAISRHLEITATQNA